jgi:hypothetical protein
MSGAEVPPGSRGPEPLNQGAAAHAHQAVFAAIAYGKYRVATLVLRDLDADQLAELIVICGDVATMTAAEQQRRGEQGSPEMPS